MHKVILSLKYLYVSLNINITFAQMLKTMTFQTQDKCYINVKIMLAGMLGCNVMNITFK